MTIKCGGKREKIALSYNIIISHGTEVTKGIVAKLFK